MNRYILSIKSTDKEPHSYKQDYPIKENSYILFYEQLEKYLQENPEKINDKFNVCFTYILRRISFYNDYQKTALKSIDADYTDEHLIQVENTLLYFAIMFDDIRLLDILFSFKVDLRELPKYVILDKMNKYKKQSISKNYYTNIIDKYKIPLNRYDKILFDLMETNIVNKQFSNFCYNNTKINDYKSVNYLSNILFYIFNNDTFDNDKIEFLKYIIANYDENNVFKEFLNKNNITLSPLQINCFINIHNNILLNKQIRSIYNYDVSDFYITIMFCSFYFSNLKRYDTTKQYIIKLIDLHNKLEQSERMNMGFINNIFKNDRNCLYNYIIKNDPSFLKYLFEKNILKKEYFDKNFITSLIIEDLIFDFIKIGIVNKDFISNIILECNHNYIINSHNYIECIKSGLISKEYINTEQYIKLLYNNYFKTFIDLLNNHYLEINNVFNIVQESLFINLLHQNEIELSNEMYNLYFKYIEDNNKLNETLFQIPKNLNEKKIFFKNVWKIYYDRYTNPIIRKIMSKIFKKINNTDIEIILRYIYVLKCHYYMTVKKDNYTSTNEEIEISFLHYLILNNYKCSVINKCLNKYPKLIENNYNKYRIYPIHCALLRNSISIFNSICNKWGKPCPNYRCEQYLKNKAKFDGQFIMLNDDKKLIDDVIDGFGYNMLKFCLLNNCKPHIIKMFLCNYKYNIYDINENNETYIIIALRIGNPEVLKAFKAVGYSINFGIITVIQQSTGKY